MRRGLPARVDARVCTLLAPLLALAATHTTAAEDGAQRPTVTVGRLAEAPRIDGLVTDEEWAGATLLDRPFTQVEPEFGAPSPFRTTIRVAQTETAVFVAFEAFDPEPERLAAAATSRDGDLGSDDSVTVMLDTFRDRRRAYAFRTNALATQWDARVADNGRTVDALWDAEWRCAARRLDDRWTAEIEIPLSVLRFEAGRDRVWGVNFARTVPRRIETALWAGAAENTWQTTGFGDLGGLELPSRSAKAWQLIPYALATAEKGADAELEVGGDARWQPSSALGLELTVNPDFALVEADVEVINLSRFELAVPEKRPFFLEGNEKYSQRIRQFYSRRLGDLEWGAKATGTTGKLDYSAIIASERLAGAASGDGTRADYAVARVQRTLPGGSTVGLLGANRRLGGEDQGSVGIDSTLFFTEKLGLTAQLLQVHGPSSDGGLAWFVRPAYDSATSHFHIRYTNLDEAIREDFNAVGFLRDDNRRELDSNYTRTFWVERGTVEKVEAGANYNRYTGQDGQLRSWELDAELEVAFRNRFAASLEVVDEYQLFEQSFSNDRVVVSAGWDSRAGQSVSTFVGSGVNFDSDLLLYGGEAAWAFGDRLRLEYSATRLELDPDPELETTWIHVLDLRYAFNPDLFVKLFLQSNSAIDKENVQALLVWRFKPPFGSFQIAYQRGTSAQGQQSDQQDTLFTKLAWVF
ncbi:MAG: DUF5916 domain-containing protein [Acidobacteriota bacterium]